MENYRISQNPGSAKKPTKRKRAQAPKRKSAQATNPTLILAAAVAGLIVIFGGIFWATKFAKKNNPASGAASGQAGVKAGAKSANGAIPEKIFKDVTTAIGNKQSQNLKGYYAKRVRVVVIRKGTNQTVNGDQVDQLINSVLNGAQTPWNWHVPPSELAAWQNGPNGQYFTGNVLVGISTDGTVISIGFDENGDIDTVFIAPAGDLTGPSTGGSTGGTGGTGGTGSTGSGGGSSTDDGTPPATAPGGAQDSD